MPNITQEEASHVITRGQIEGQGRWPISKGGASRLGHLAAQGLLLRGYPFAELVRLRMSPQDLEDIVAATLQMHKDAVEFWGGPMRPTKERLERVIPFQNIAVSAAAWAGYAGAATRNEMEQLRLLRPGDQAFDETAAALESPEVRQRVATLMEIANKATTTGRGAEVAFHYQGALMADSNPDAIREDLREAVLDDFPADIVAAGRDALRAAATEGPNSHLGRILLDSLADAGEIDHYAQAMALNLVANPDAQLMRVLRGRLDVNDI